MQKEFIGTVISSMLLALFVAVTSGCGGSSAGSAVDAVAYSGKVTQATITADNSDAMLAGAWGGAIASPPTTLAKAIAGKEIPAAMPVKVLDALTMDLFTRPLVGKQGTAEAVAASKVAGKVTNGRVSGTMISSGSVNSDGTGTLNLSFFNYNNGDGNTYDGSGILTVTGYDASRVVVTHSSLFLQRLTSKGASGSYSISGSISVHNDPVHPSALQTFNVVIRNDDTGQTMKMEQYSISRSFDDWFLPTKCSEVRAGRLYVDAYGYVDVTQSSPLVYNDYKKFNEDIPESGGPLLLTGKGGSQLRMTPISLSQFKVEVDADGDGSYEISRIDSWSQYTGVVYKFRQAIGSSFCKGSSVKPTSDGGYIVTGFLRPPGINLPTEVYLVKTNAAGEVEWEKTFGGTTAKIGNAVLETSDHGFIVAGYSYPAGSYSFGNGGEQIDLIRTDAAGNLLWEKAFTAGSQWAWAYSIKGTGDGGFIIMGGTSGGAVYLLKITADGDKQWDKALGTGREVGDAIALTDDGGYLISGYSFATSTGYNAIYLVRTDASGNVVWQKTIEKTSSARAYSVIKTVSGNFVIAGYATNGGYLASIDAAGNILWENSFNGYDDFRGVVEAPDGSLVLAANSTPSQEIYLVKTDAQGTLQWQQQVPDVTYGSLPYGYSIELAMDGGYVVAGKVDMYKTSGFQDAVLLVKSDSKGVSR